jgi:hypothetical protein
MVIARHARAKERGTVFAEMAVAMAVLVIAMLPLAFAATSDARDLRLTYQKAIAREIVDGEMEVLAGGEWRRIAEGIHPYTIHAAAVTNLPPGNFQISKTSNLLRLEWRPAKKIGIGTIAREVKLK